RLQEKMDYREAFAAAFNDDGFITPDRVAKALAAFERTLITSDSPYDRFISGDTSAFTTRQVRGMFLFEAVRCVVCHAGPNFSEASLLSPRKGMAALRRFPSLPSPYTAKYRLTDDLGAATSGTAGVWRIPSLRNVAITGPWFHNGAVDDLKEAVRIMATVQA